ncbi:hypothetical protein HA402_009083 [Bradysia odoriphaga]|nr:hypothetical protein HA402_009083 [Bradysia odoriphaga]
MDRRSRAISVNNRSEMADDSTPEQSPVPRKRKRQDPSELCQQLYDSIRNVKKSDGSMLCDTFIRAPKRRQEPSYYEVVEHPIDLLRIQQKLKTESYDDIDDLASDIELLIKNAKAFYKPGTSEHQDAVLLWDTFNSNKSKLMDSVEDDGPAVKVKRIGRPRKSAMDVDDASETSSLKADDDFELFEELFSSVMTACDENNRPLHLMFQLLPSKKYYSEYYDIIDHPIDLKFIATKIQTSAYTSLNEMEKDLLQMTKNACTFNEPGSQIYKDAKTLKKIFTAKKIELESGKFRATAKPKRKGISLSAATAALKEPVDDSDDDNDDSMETDGDGPLWQLFDQLYNTANASDHPNNASGTPLGESLWKLPNRRFNPEYYTNVKKPISMSQIRKKLKLGNYTNITDMTGDLYLMLDNARKAFPPAHKVYKDAAKMLKILNQKLVDAAVDQDDSETEDGDASLASLASALSNSSPGTPKPKKGRPRLLANTVTPAHGAHGAMSTPGLIKPRLNNALSLKKKLLSLQKYLSDYTINDRKPMALFTEKPSKKLYPDYYQVIQHPIDMNTIEANIRSDHYNTLDDIVGDFRLMFSNCRKYNEENSQIYEDSNVLERAMNDKLKELSSIDRKATPKSARRKNIHSAPVDTKLKQLYEAIRDFRDPKANRQLALIFMKLPSKNDYPDYYDIIKNPIDMEKIAHKLKTQVYETVDEIASDFMLMFENACKYNEPDSQLYKDALVLQQICIQTKQSLRDADETVPDVPQAVQELLMSLFTSFYNHQDEEGRCFSDSLAELPEYDETESGKVRAISLDLLKRRLDKGLYKRLDTFQEDVFACLDRARRLSRTDSQIFEDSIELQSFFIRKRDELCKDVLNSPAINFTLMHLTAAAETIKQSKLLQEEHETEVENEISTQQGESMTIDQKVYSPGDYVYYDVPENKVPGIIYIERLWTNTEGVKMMFGNVFLRPFETFHVTTRKFLEKEIFKSEQHIALPLTQLGEKCFVMSAKDYIKYTPEGFVEKDVYVCESRYSMKLRQFKKIKNWPFNNSAKMIPRETPWEPKRVMSVFKERVEKHKGELAELQLQEALVEKEKPNIQLTVTNAEEGHVHYQQYNSICSGVVKTGDYVYVATESGKQSIAQIHSIWETKEGKSFFRGPWFLTPTEVPGTSARSFYRQELMLSTVQDTSPMVAIVGRCAVLEYREYSAFRPTEIAESDVFVCESTYDELKKQIRRNHPGTALRKFKHSQLVTQDEIYHFKRPIAPAKVRGSELMNSHDQMKQPPPMTTMIEMDHHHIKNETEMLLMEDSLDGGPSIGSDIVPSSLSSPPPVTMTQAHHQTQHGNHAIVSSAASTPITVKKKEKEKKGKLVTGYILYSSEVRKDRAQSNPDCSFGDISRLVGNEWRSLPAFERQIWEEKAQKYNEESALKFAEETGCPVSPAPAQSFFTAEPLPNQIFECCWAKCDWQFEDPMDCFDHCIAEGTGHVQTYYANLPADEAAEYVCLWRGCIRLKKSMPAFPHMQRLIKHVREVHINKSGKIVQPHDRSKNLMPSKKQSVVTQLPQPTAATPTAQGSTTTINTTTVQTTSIPTTLHIPSNAPAEPLFVVVPPRPQRVLHSEAYIKYIEGLQNDTRFITPWEKTLRTTQETAPAVDLSKLPINWLHKSVQSKPEEAVSALWRLRNYMMRDVVQLQRHQY